MNAIYFLIPLTVIILILAIRVLVWAMKNNQFDDLETPALRILSDDDEKPMPTQTESVNDEESR